MLKDYLAKLPIDVLADTILDETEIHLPTKINHNEFYKENREQITAEGLTDEKAIYLASINPSRKLKTIPSLLVKGR